MVWCILEAGGVEHSDFIPTPFSQISTRLLMEKSSRIYCLPPQK